MVVSIKFGLTRENVLPPGLHVLYIYLRHTHTMSSGSVGQSLVLSGAQIHWPAHHLALCLYYVVNIH